MRTVAALEAAGAKLRSKIVAGLRRILILGFGLLCSSLTASASAQTADAAFREAVAEIMRSNAVPGTAIAVVRDGRVWLSEGFGSARMAARVSPQTPFMIASLSKAFTAAAVLQLVEAGRVDLDAPVRSYLPLFSVAEEGVSARTTVRHLLNHTSGLSDPGYPEMRLPPTTTLEDRVVRLRAARASSDPGETFQYFNANYAVLARLVVQVSGVPFQDYLAKELFEPLGMHRTISVVTMSEAREKVSDLAQGHVELFGRALAWSEGEGNLAGSGGVVSTAEDMARWLAMLASHGELDGRRVLSRESIDIMQRAAAGSPYAMGWFVSSRGGEPILLHDGILSTYHAEAMLLPRTGDAVVILVNVNSVPHALLTVPRLRNAALSVLRDYPEPSGLSVRQIGAVAGVVSVTLIVLLARQLLRTGGIFDQPQSLRMVRIAWRLLPLSTLVSLPYLVQQASGRAFDFPSVTLAMLDLIVPLGLASLLGVVSLRPLTRRTNNVAEDG